MNRSKPVIAVVAILVISLLYLSLAGTPRLSVLAWPIRDADGTGRTVLFPWVGRNAPGIPPTPTTTPTLAPTPIPTPEAQCTPPSPMTIVTDSVPLLNPALAYDTKNNRFLVVWESLPPLDSGDAGQVWAQLLKPDSQPVGEPWLLSRGHSLAARPDVAYNPISREYLVVWCKTTNDGHGEIHRQALSPSGDRRFANTRVVSDVGLWSQTSIACNANTGRYYLAWSDAPIASQADIYGLELDPEGNVSSTVIDLCPGGGIEKEVDVAYNAERGTFLVAWEDHSSGHNQGKVCYTILDHEGMPWGRSYVDPISSAPQSLPALPDSSIGREWLVLWGDARLPGDWDIWSMLVPGGSPGLVSNHRTQQRYSGVASDEAKQYLLVWHNTPPDPPDDDISSDVFACCMDQVGQALGNVWTLASDSYGQSAPAVAFSNENGTYLVIWQHREEDLYELRGVPVTSCVSWPPKLQVALTVEPRAACRGDTLQYQVSIYNSSPRPATNIVFTDSFGTDLALVGGSVTTSHGTIRSGQNTGDTQVQVDISSIPCGSTVVIRFEAKIATPLSSGLAEVSNQGWVNCDGLSGIPSDDPQTKVPGDPTIVQIGQLKALQQDKLVNDADGDTVASPGDTLEYRVEVTNKTTCAQHDVILRESLEPNTELVASSVQADLASTIITGNDPGAKDIEVHLGAMLPGDTRVVRFRARVKQAPPPSPIEICNQGSVESHESGTIDTDDPDTEEASDATCMPIVLFWDDGHDDTGIPLEPQSGHQLAVRFSMPSQRKVTKFIFWLGSKTPPKTVKLRLQDCQATDIVTSTATLTVSKGGWVVVDLPEHDKCTDCFFAVFEYATDLDLYLGLDKTSIYKDTSYEGPPLLPCTEGNIMIRALTERQDH
jgi:uncharacterized repeat protein (TIGR01451 family)